MVRQETVLICAVNPQRRAELVGVIESANWLPLVAASAEQALEILDDAPPDLFILAIDGDTGHELEVLDRARSGPEGEHVPIVCLLDRKHRRLTLEAFGRRADDVVSGKHHQSELIARLRTRIERPPVPRAKLIEDPVTGVLTPEAFHQQLTKEHERVQRGGDPGALAFLAIDELPELTARHGSRGRDELLAQVVRLIKADGRKLDFVGSRRSVLAMLLPTTPKKGAQIRFDRLVRKIYDADFEVDGTIVRLTPVIGFTQTLTGVSVDDVEERTWDALMYQADQLDLHPTSWVAAMSSPKSSTSALKRAFERVRTPFQVITQQVAALLVPFLTYWSLDKIGVDITGVVYLALVIALAITATSIIVECRAACKRPEPPEAPDAPPPRASAIIAAYLPNEAGTVVETVEAFLTQDYPDLQIILAYNTPQRLDVEDELQAIAERDPRFVPLRVDGSVSKAQNVNTALAHVTGEFVGLFDADHHPAPGSFFRAWRWIASGVGVVQGHCVIRNGDDNFVTRLVATEFESIYAVSHPGRARLHGFGIFGGSNGYWRTSLLHRTRMRGSMLTEDIDSSMRVVQSGERIVNDPDLVSTELAPDTMGALWNQRLRWAQGWSQVSLRHFINMMRRAPSMRSRFGVFYLLGWREVYPWVSLQMFPLLAFWWVQGEPAIDWFVPIFICTSLLTFSAGPIQAWYAYRLADPSIKARRRWFVQMVVSSLVFYTEWKNIIGRTAHLKELMRERKWKVTPRAGSVELDAVEAPSHGPNRTRDPVETNESETTAHEAPERASDVVAAGVEPATPTPTPTPTAAPDPSHDIRPTRQNGRKRIKRTRRHRETVRAAARTKRPWARDPRHDARPRHRPLSIYDVELEEQPISIYDVEREDSVDRRPTRVDSRRRVVEQNERRRHDPSPVATDLVEPIEITPRAPAPLPIAASHLLYEPDYRLQLIRRTASPADTSIDVIRLGSDARAAADHDDDREPVADDPKPAASTPANC